MKTLTCVGKCGILLLILFLSQRCQAQEQRSNISLIIGGYYFNPNLDEINEVYRTIEHNYSLPGGNDFKNYYTIIAGISFKPVPQQSIQLEVGGSVYRTSPSGSQGENRCANFLSMYYIGGTYLIHIPIGRVEGFIGGGPGYVWLNSERTYTVESGTASVNGQLAQLHGVCGIEFLLPRGVSLSLEAGYSYATTLFPERSDLDLTLKSPTYGVMLNIPLFKI